MSFLSRTRSVTFAAPVRLLALRDFSLLWGSTTSYYAARWSEIVVLGWIALELTDSPFFVALVAFFRSAPLLACAPITGALADRVERKRMMLVGQALGTAGSVTLLIALWADLLTPAVLVVSSLLCGVAWATDWPVRRSIVPDIVPKDQVFRAVALDTLAINATKIAGPIVAGLLLYWGGGAAAYPVITAMYLTSFTLVLRLRVPARSFQQSGAPMLQSMIEGLGYVRRNEAVFGVFVVSIFANLLIFPYLQLMSIYARDVLFVGPRELGLLNAADGIGALLGGVIIAMRSQIRRRGQVFLGATLVASLLLGAFSTSRSLELSVAIQIAFGIAIAAFSTLQSTIMLGAADDALRGRVMGMLMLAIGAGPVGALLTGWQVTVVGPTNALAINAAICFVLTVVVAARLVGFRRY